METEIEQVFTLTGPELQVPGIDATLIPVGRSGGDAEMISGFRKEIIEMKIRANIARLVFKNFRNPFSFFSILSTLDKNRRKYSGESRVKKIAKINNKYYWDLYIPGWPSKAFDKFFEAEINRIRPVDARTNRFSNIFLALTKKCTLQCEHCLEWDALNGKKKLRPEDIKNILNRFQDKGTGQIFLTGGEPLLRIKEILEILSGSKNETEFWLLTSGYNLTRENARKLKEAGLTGVVISMDHFRGDLHNTFRGYDKSFEWVQHAAANAIRAGLVAAVSVCVTKSFVEEASLFAYAELAKKMGVSFIQMLEPKAVGHYKGSDVILPQDKISILESFYLKMNFEKEFNDYPILNYPGYHQRRAGCFAAGNRNLYIDTDGDLHACPFCQKKCGSALDADLDKSIEQLQAAGCHDFQPAQF